MARIKFIKNENEYTKKEYKPKSIRFRKIATFYKIKAKEFRKKYFIYRAISIIEFLGIIYLMVGK